MPTWRMHHLAASSITNSLSVTFAVPLTVIQVLDRTQSADVFGVTGVLNTTGTVTGRATAPLRTSDARMIRWKSTPTTTPEKSTRAPSYFSFRLDSHSAFCFL